MDDIKQKKIKADDKNRLRHYLYHKRINCYYPHLTFPSGQRYQLEFNSFADINKSLIDHFLLFFSSIYQIIPNRPNHRPFNLCFKYLIELYHLHDRYIPNNIKTTQQKTLNMYEILGSDMSEELKKEFKGLNDQIQSQITDQLKAELGKSYKQEKMPAKKIMAVRHIKNKLLEKYLQQILTIQQQQRRRIYIPQTMEAVGQKYVKKLLLALRNLQFTKKKYRAIKMQDFTNSYQKYWQTVLPYQQDKRIQNKVLIMKRYTIISSKSPSQYHFEEVLTTLRDLVIHNRSKDCQKEYLAMMKQLCLELKQHKKSTGKHYPLLHPKNIIINQISLRVHLSYQSPLRSALGLLKQPTSALQSLVLAATPDIFDPFSAPNEHLTEEQQQYGIGQQIFYDLTYGIDSLLDLYDQRCRDKNISQSVVGEKTMLQIKQQHDQFSETWRYLMIFSYVMNNKQYYRNFLSITDNLNSFKKFLKNEERKYANGDYKQYAESVIGQSIVQKKIKLNFSKEFSLSIFDIFIGVKNQDSIQASPFRFFKIDSFLVRKKQLEKNIIKIIIDKKSKMFNPVKHLILFYMSVYQSYFHMKLICQMLLKDMEKGMAIFVQIKDKHKLTINNLNQLIDKNSYIHASYQKFLDYEAKNKTNPRQQFRYLLKNYQKEYIAIKNQRNIYADLKQQIQSILFGNFAKELITLKMQQMLNQILPIMKTCKKYLIDISDFQFRHKKEVLSEQLRKVETQKYELQIKILLFLTLTQDTLDYFDALVFPFLNMDAEQKESIEMYQHFLDIIRQVGSREDECFYRRE